jgi:hypothetical protein
MAIIKDITEIKFLPHPTNASFKNIKGMRFNRLIAIEYVGTSASRLAEWLFLCDCGNYALIEGSYVSRGNTKSCGCYKIDDHIRRNTKHGVTKNKGTSKCYMAWKHIKQRCLTKSCSRFHDYGGRGIKIHPAWINDFQSFYNHIGEPPTKDHSIDRINNSRGYEPGNIRWATNVEQARNKRVNSTLTMDGQTLCMAEWASILPISYSTIRSRKRYGWCDKCALTKPIRSDYRIRHTCTHCVETESNQ